MRITNSILSGRSRLLSMHRRLLGTRKRHDDKTTKSSGKDFWRSVGSILIAIVASSHHWLHMLLLTLGLGVLGVGITTMPLTLRIVLVVFSFVVSIGMLFVAWRKRIHNKVVAWVYFFSSVLSLVILATSLPVLVQTNTPAPSAHEQHHHSDM